jgi:hypothetical protein
MQVVSEYSNSFCNEHPLDINKKTIVQKLKTKASNQTYGNSRREPPKAKTVLE